MKRAILGLLVGAGVVALAVGLLDRRQEAMAQHPFAINPNPDLERLARERGWTVYFPDGTARVA